MSFGFKHGIPIDADLVFDVRFLPNPHYIDHMRPKTGMDEEVSSYVLKWTETQKFIEKVTDLLSFMLPHYKREGKAQLVIAIGCTGGQHRSVALAEQSDIFMRRIIILKFRIVISKKERKNEHDDKQDSLKSSSLVVEQDCPFF